MVEIIPGVEAKGLDHIQRGAVLLLFLQNPALLLSGVEQPLSDHSLLEQNSLGDHERGLVELLETQKLEK